MGNGGLDVREGAYERFWRVPHANVNGGGSVSRVLSRLLSLSLSFALVRFRLLSTKGSPKGRGGYGGSVSRVLFLLLSLSLSLALVRSRLLATQGSPNG